MEQPQNRITGTEMEWGVLARQTDYEGTRQLTAEQLAPFIKAYLTKVPHMRERTSEVAASKCFLGNGARFYSDIGAHREYATPEDDSFSGTFANEVAGEQILYDALSEVVQTVHGARTIGSFSLNKRVVGDDGETWGSHESYSCLADKLEISESGLALLGVHLATRSIYTGAGSLDTKGNYYLAQKAPYLNQGFNLSAHGSSNPVVNLRDEPLVAKDKDAKYLRVHVTSGDPNMSPWATKMKLATTSLVLRLIEHDVTLDNLRFRSELDAVARMVAGDLSLEKPLRLRNGTRTTALGVQKRLSQAGRLLSQEVKLPDEELWALKELEGFCTDANHDINNVSSRAEWLLKLRMLQRHHDRHGDAWTSLEMRRKERQWDFIGPKSIGMRLRETVWSDDMPDESLIHERKSSPPTTTRANVRGTFIAHFSEDKGAFAGWDELASNQANIVKLPDPYASHDDTIDHLIDSKAKAA